MHVTQDHREHMNKMSKKGKEQITEKLYRKLFGITLAEAAIEIKTKRKI